MTQILANLPVKSLLKFRVVCKLWCSLISSHQFVRKQLSLCASNTPRIIMNPSNLLYDLGFYSVNDSIVLDETSIDIRIGGYNRFCVMGSCDGLICLKEGVTGTILLWNPSTKDFKALPSTSEVGVVHVERKDDEWIYGFGYDYNSDDFKVLILLPYRSILHGYNGFSYRSIIYTLRSNSWRRIQDSPLGILFTIKHSAFASGALHWSAAKTDCIGAIVSFDLTSETYKELPLPHPDIRCYKLEAGASIGKLLAREDDDRGYYIWVMKEYGVLESWTKTVKIPRMRGTVGRIILQPMTWFMENGEILLYASWNPVSYNANKNSLVYFAWDDIIDSYHPRCVEYVCRELSLTQCLQPWSE